MTIVSMKTYTGDNSGAGAQKVIVKELRPRIKDEGMLIRDYELLPGPSLKLWNHSPDGFQWGYQGSGCAQLALAVLLDLTGDAELSLRLHQEFKRHFIATSGKHLALTEPDIKAWLLVA